MTLQLGFGGSDSYRGWADAGISDFPTFPLPVSYIVEYSTLPGTLFGACCLDGFCLTSTASDCLANGGTWGGANSSCSDYDCSAACIADLDGDGDVDGADLSVLLSSWGVCP